MQTILVCDDDKEIVEAIEIYLQQEGFHVLKAYDGEEALEILKNNEVHLLIMDVMMPKLDGIRATLKIRENSSIPIIILSAKTEDADKILGLNIGADDYISKPFNPLELVARVKSQLRRYMHLGNVADENMSVYRVGGLEINDDLKEVKNKIEKFITEELYLSFNSKTNIFKSKQGVNFCGYKINEYRMKLRNKGKKRIKKNIITMRWLGQ